ncbi:unnamed protein product [Caenorhabditis brenneri]
MIFIILLISSISETITADYGNSYGGSEHVYLDLSRHHHKNEVLKLSVLDGTGIFPADIQYFMDKNHDYAAISCKPNPNTDYFTWILINKDKNDKQDDFSTVDDVTPDTIPLAGGINITYVAQYGKDDKWTGMDILYYRKREFRRVGCWFSSYERSKISFD